MRRRGEAVRRDLERRYPDRDWLAALAKAAVASRADVEAMLDAEFIPPELEQAAAEVDALMAPPDPGAADRDRPFSASTNDADAIMEVDGEAGLNATPAPKWRPSQTGSPHEAGERPAPVDRQHRRDEGA
jgi:hypothetical protein